MSRWKELPGSLDQRVRQLVVQMRRMKDHSGLSLAALAGRTGYSRSSWERYLNGKQLPPRQAVEELARACEAEPSRLLVLHELAEQAEQDEQTQQLEHAEQAEQAEQAEGDPPEAAAPADGRKRRRGLWVALSLVVVCAVVVGGLLAARPWQDEKEDAGDRKKAETEAYVYEPGRTYSCDVRREDGKLYAGRSDTDKAVLQQSTTSWDVVEAQCLLNHHGFEHGEVDGIYGNLTERAVKRFQKARQKDFGLVVDGKVGQHTWEALRD